MKKIAKLSFFYSILGLFLGVFYREFTKINGFTGKTVLGGLHTHALVLGALFFLIVLILEKSFELTKSSKYKKFSITYNVGLILLIIMMAIRGCIEVLGTEISSAVDASISGMAGISHIIMAVGYVLFFLTLFNRINEVENKK